MDILSIDVPVVPPPCRFDCFLELREEYLVQLYNQNMGSQMLMYVGIYYIYYITQM